MILTVGNLIIVYNFYTKNSQETRTIALLPLSNPMEHQIILFRLLQSFIYDKQIPLIAVMVDVLKRRDKYYSGDDRYATGYHDWDVQEGL